MRWMALSCDLVHCSLTLIGAACPALQTVMDAAQSDNAIIVVLAIVCGVALVSAFIAVALVMRQNRASMSQTLPAGVQGEVIEGSWASSGQAATMVPMGIPEHGGSQRYHGGMEMATVDEHERWEKDRASSRPHVNI